MKAFLIDPTTQTVTEVEQDGLDDLYRLIECETVCAVPIAAGDAIYLDDNGLYADPIQPSFAYRGYPQALTGKGLVVGSDDEGFDIEPNHSLKQLEARITWLGVMKIEPQIEVYSWNG